MRLSQQLSSAGSLLDATEAIGNWRALALLGATIVSTVLLPYLFTLTGSGALMSFGMLLALVVMFYGVNAVGIMLMDAARGAESRSMLDAVLSSLFSSHRLLLVALAAVASLLLLVLVLALLLVLCKIPGLGPLLLTFVLPLGALAFGFVIFALIYVCYPLAAAAVWSGAGTRETLVNLVTIVRQRLVSVVVKEVLLMLLIWLVALIIGGIVFTGLAAVGGMSFGILSSQLAQGAESITGLLAGFVGSEMGGMGGMDSMAASGGSSAYLLAAGLGSVLLLAVAMIVPGLIAMQGFCQIYLSSVEGLDVSDTERELARRQQQLAQKRQEIQASMDERRARASSGSPALAPVAAVVEEAACVPDSPASQAALAGAACCPQCHAALEEEDDKFCGQCGHQLR
jgi:hypothetical protein